MHSGKRDVNVVRPIFFGGVGYATSFFSAMLNAGLHRSSVAIGVFNYNVNISNTSVCDVRSRILTSQNTDEKTVPLESTQNIPGTKDYSSN